MWRPHAELPRTHKEAAAHRTAHDRLGEILEEMIGGDEATRLKKAARFRQSGGARRKRDTRTDDSRDAWETLLAYARAKQIDLLAAPLTKTLLTGCVMELTRGRYRTCKGNPWTREGVKSLLRRRRGP